MESTVTDSAQTPAEQELAALLVNSLNIEGIEAAAINPEAPLFGEGDLGLDSIDALELALAYPSTTASSCAQTIRTTGRSSAACARCRPMWKSIVPADSS